MTASVANSDSAPSTSKALAVAMKDSTSFRMMPNSSDIADRCVGNGLREAASEQGRGSLETGTDFAPQNAPAGLGCRHRRERVAVDRIKNGMRDLAIRAGDFDGRLVAVRQPLLFTRAVWK